MQDPVVLMLPKNLSKLAAKPRASDVSSASPCSSGISSLQSDDSLATLKDHRRRHHHGSSSSSSPSPINSFLQNNGSNNNNNNRVVDSSTLLTPVSELTARLKGPFALRDDGDSSELDDDVVEKPPPLSTRLVDSETDADDDKENSNGVSTTTTTMASNGLNLMAHGSNSLKKSDSSGGIKKAKLESVVDFDLTPTASAKDAPYVSEAELDALLDNYDDDISNAAPIVKASNAGVVGVGFAGIDDLLDDLVDVSSSSKLIEVTDNELDGLLTDNGEGLLDSGHSSGGEVSSLLDSIDDIPSASVEIPSISDSTFSEDIPNLQQLPVDEARVAGSGGGAVATAAAAATITAAVTNRQSQPTQQQPLLPCPPSGARPKIRPGSLGVVASTLPAVSCESGSNNNDVDDANAVDDNDDEGSMTMFTGAGALDDMTPTNHLPSSVDRFDDQPPSSTNHVSSSTSSLVSTTSSGHPNVNDNHLTLSSSQFSQVSDSTVVRGSDVNGFSGPSSSSSSSSLDRHISSSLARHNVTASSSSSSSSSSFTTIPATTAQPHLSSSPLSSFTTQSYPNIASSVCNNSINDQLVISTTGDEPDAGITHQYSSSSSVKSKQQHGNRSSQNVTDPNNDDTDDKIASNNRTNPDNCNDKTEDVTSVTHVAPSSPLISSSSSSPFTHSSTAAASSSSATTNPPIGSSYLPCSTNEDACLTPDTPDSEEDLDQSSSSIRHVTSPPTPFVKGGLLDGDDDDDDNEDDDDEGVEDDPNDTLPTPTTGDGLNLDADESTHDGDLDCVDGLAVNGGSGGAGVMDDDVVMNSKSSSPVVEAVDACDSTDVTMEDSAQAHVAVGASAEATVEAAVCDCVEDSASTAMDASSSAVADSSSVSSSSSDSVRQLEPSRPSAKRPSSLDLPSRSPFAFKPQKRHHKGVDDPSPSLDSVRLSAA